MLSYGNGNGGVASRTLSLVNVAVACPPRALHRLLGTRPEAKRTMEMGAVREVESPHGDRLVWAVFAGRCFPLRRRRSSLCRTQTGAARAGRSAVQPHRAKG
jgi:hypothetical protein